MAIQSHRWGAQPRDGFTVELLDGDLPVVVKLSGELDVATSPRLRACLEWLGSDGSPDVLVDLEGLTFIDSSGISAMVMNCKRIRSQGGTFSVVSCQPDVRRPLQITGVLEYLRAPVPL